MLKSLHRNDTQTLPYIATKNWNLSNVVNEDLILMEHTGSDGPPVAIEYLDYRTTNPIVQYGCNLAKEQQDLNKIVPRTGLKTTGIFYPELDPKNDDGTYQRVVYSQIVSTFYNNYRNPVEMWGMEEIDFDKSQTKKFVADKFKMFAIPRIVFGEKVIENTVVLYDTTTDNDYTITDDGHCNLFAGTNLFSHQQEVRSHDNEFDLGFDYFCEEYNSSTSSIPESPISLSVESGSAILLWQTGSKFQNTGFFVVQRSLDGLNYSNFSNVLPTPVELVTNYTDTTVTSSIDGTTYWYRVASVNEYDTSSFSNTASITFTSLNARWPNNFVASPWEYISGPYHPPSFDWSSGGFTDSSASFQVSASHYGLNESLPLLYSASTVGTYTGIQTSASIHLYSHLFYGINGGYFGSIQISQSGVGIFSHRTLYGNHDDVFSFVLSSGINTPLIVNIEGSIYPWYDATIYMKGSFTIP